MARKKGIALLLCSLSLMACDEEHLSPLSQAEPVIEKPSDTALIIKGYCVREGYQFRDFWMTGLSYEIEGGEIRFDSDRDGIPNVRDTSSALGLNYLSRDTNADGYGDLLIYQAGLLLADQAALQNAHFCADTTTDTDHDDLTDCEETNLAHTDPHKFDSDFDGIPDGLEVRFGLNPLDPEDVDQSLASDGMENGVKIKKNLPILESVNDSILAIALKYSIQPLIGEDRARECYDIRVSNIPLLAISTGNAVRLHFFEQDIAGRSAYRSEDVLLDVIETKNDGKTYNYEDGNGSAWNVQDLP